MALKVDLTKLSLPFLLAATPALADLRDDLHTAARAGHQPIGYSQTDEAMEPIYADPSSPGNIVLFYTGRSQNADLWVSNNAQDGWNREHVWPQSRGVQLSSPLCLGHVFWLL